MKDAPKPEGESKTESPLVGMLKTVSMAAAFGAILCPDQKSKNDWQARMLKAGLGNSGLMMPDNWDQLSEDEKEKRLTGALGAIA